MNFKPCGCGWEDDKTYVECPEHVALRKKIEKLMFENELQKTELQRVRKAYFEALATPGARGMKTDKKTAVTDTIRCTACGTVRSVHDSVSIKVKELLDEIARLKSERDELQTAINNFCERTKHSDPFWLKQDYIKGLFDLWQEEQGE